MRKLERDWILLIKDCENSHKQAIIDANRSVYVSCALSLLIDINIVCAIPRGHLLVAAIMSACSALIIWSGISLRNFNLSFAARQLQHRQECVDYLNEYRRDIKPFLG